MLSGEDRPMPDVKPGDRVTGPDGSVWTVHAIGDTPWETTHGEDWPVVLTRTVTTDEAELTTLSCIGKHHQYRPVPEDVDG